ncbi:MAG: Re/Si-specific NAD(P)(+) transhydrogenase subunit alpha [Deltaproteobacteria bacterium]|nr:Re/Si-specific NAD(P)(+) transhydrogenase subunit alpha [Deltaproteobacteria bacterium]
MKVGIPRETALRERRVAATPDTVQRLRRLGFDVAIEAGAGATAGFEDTAYVDAGAEVLPDAAAVFAAADVVLKVEPPSPAEVAALREGATVFSFVWPKRNPELLEALAARKVTALAMDMVPRITRAQKLDALSSMANIAGYRAVVEAAAAYGSFFGPQFTAAGKVDAAKVLIIGAGVAGLAAVGAAKGLGAQVRAFDTRPAVKDEVQSLGGTFLELDFEEAGDGGGGYAKVMSPEFIAAEMALFREQAKEVDVVITTALVPGTKAPVLWDAGMVEAMKPGSVIVDLAAHQGGNCALTRADEVVVHQGVTIIGHTDLASRMAGTASQLYGMNLVHFLDDMGGGAGFKVDVEDVVVRGALVAHDGAVTYPPPPPPAPTPAAAVPGTPAPAPKPAAPAPAPVARPASEKRSKGHGHGAPTGGKPLLSGPVFSAVGVVLAAVWLVLVATAPPGEAAEGARTLLQHLTVFVLACFVGWQVVWNVTPALHTPLMSVTNAVSGIIIVGGILEGARGGELHASIVLGLVAALIATINIAGGFLVTQRMLRMFRRD